MSTRLFAREIQVLNTLSASEKPMTSSEIVDNNQDLTQSTVMAVLRKLDRQGMIKVDGKVYSRNVLSRTYVVTEKGRAEALLYVLEEYEGIQNIIPKSLLIKRLIDMEPNEEEKRQLLQEIQRMADTIEKYV